METYDFRYFATDKGRELLRAKRYGDNIVPFGTYYDEGERAERVQSRLKNDLIPMLRLIEGLTAQEYGILPYFITFNGQTDYESFNSLRLYEFEQFCKDHIYHYSPDYFKILVNMEIRKGPLSWEAQFTLQTDCIRLQDEDAVEEYPVWYIVFGDLHDSFYETLDENYSASMIKDIVKWAMELIRSNYEFTIAESK